MKFKILITSITIIFIVIVIYMLNLDKKIYVLELSETDYSKYVSIYFKKSNKFEKYVNGFLEKDDRIVDLINDVNNNKNIQIGENDYTLQNSLIKADLIILQIGTEEIKYIENYNDVDEYLNDLEQLFKLIRKYSKEKIVYIGSKIENRFEEYANNRIEKLCDNNNINYIKYDDYLTEAKLLSMVSTG